MGVNAVVRICGGIDLTGKYFGTDGFRGCAGDTINSEQAFKVGRFLGWYYTAKGGRCRVVIGKDPRLSSYTLEYAIAAGITASGGDAYILHVTTTPSVSFVTRCEGFDCGVMISASHNNFLDNGIKLVNSRGEKMERGVLNLIEDYIDGRLFIGGEPFSIPFARGDRIGRTVDHVAGRNRYIGHLISLSTCSYKGLKVGLDCANGSSYKIARSVFDALGATVYEIGGEPNGLNVNEGCGATHPNALSRLVKDNALDIGFAFDGDADRMLIVDEDGEIIDGDKIIAVCAKYMKQQGKLQNDTAVVTVMSNMGFFKFCEENGIRCEKTKVGDRYVLENMVANGYSIGGEQSGHIIFLDHATTGDGQMSAIQVLNVLKRTGKKISELASEMQVFPQVLINVRVSNFGKTRLEKDEEVQLAVREASEELGEDGRVLVRVSGTEPLVRVMLEGKDLAKIQYLAECIAKVIEERLV